MRFMSDRNDWFAGAEERNNCSDKGSKDSNLQYNKSYGENVYKVSDEKENNLLKKAHYVLTLVKNDANQLNHVLNQTAQWCGGYHRCLSTRRSWV